MLKVAVLPSWFPSWRSPLSGIFILEQAETLAQVMEVAVVVPHNRSWRDILRLRGRRGTWMSREGKLTIISQSWQSAFPRCPASWNLGRQVRAFSRGMDFLVEHWGCPDILHAHIVLPAGLAAVEIGRRLRIPVVLTEHSGPFAMHLKTAQQRNCVLRVLHDADRVLAVSPGLAQQINEFAPRVPIIVTGNLIKTLFFTPPSDGSQGRSETRFLTVSALSAEKGIFFLLEAAQLLMQRGVTDFSLLIGGDGASRKELERRAADLGLSSHCHFLGMLNRDQVRLRMQECDALVHPSLHETFAIVVGEAMACGKPVVATRCGGPEYVVPPEGGILVEPGDAIGLSRALEQVVRGRSQFFGCTIRKSIQDRFGEQAFLNTHADIYADLLAEFHRDPRRGANVRKH